LQNAGTFHPYAHQMQRLLATCVRSIEVSLTRPGAGPVDDAKFLLRVFLVLSDDSAWRADGAPPGADRLFCAAVLRRVVAGGMYGSVCRALLKLQIMLPPGLRAAPNEQMLSTLMAMAVRPFAYGSQVAQPALFGTTVLALPFIFHHLPALGAKLLDTERIWMAVVSALAAGSVFAPVPFEGVEFGRAWLLGNLLHMSHARLQKASYTVLALYVQVLNVLWKTLPSPNSSSMNVDSETHVDAVNSPVVNLMSDMPPTLSKQLELFTSTVHISALLRILTESPKSGAADASAVHADLAVGTLCELILGVMQQQPSLEEPLLSSFAFVPYTVTTLGELFVSRPGLTEFAMLPAFGGGTPIAGSTLDPLTVGLGSIFALAFDFLLMTYDDSEFFDKQQPFALSRLSEIVKLIKDVTFRLYWCSLTDDSRSPDLHTLQRSLMRLLRKLYDRNSRRQFLQPHEWCCREVTVHSILNDRTVVEMFHSTEEFDSRAASLLRHIPFVLSFEDRALIFHHMVRQERDGMSDFPHSDWIRVRIRRDFVVEDGFSSLANLGKTAESAVRGQSWKKTVQIQFINSDGLEEAGIDGGGVFKEFLSELVKKAFDPGFGLFLSTADRLLYPNPSANLVHSEHARLFEFLGNVVGKAIWENVLVELPLCTFFLGKILGKPNYVNDLPSLDMELHRNLMFLKNYPGDVENDLSLNFTIADDKLGHTHVVELVPGGRDLAVTKENRIRYIYLVADYRLNKQIATASAAFMRGLQHVVRPEWLRMFNHEELQRIISGSTGELDLLDLQRNCVYSGGYYAEHPSILCFWAAVATFDPEQKRNLLLFATSCSRAPLLGFKNLHPNFCIHKSGDDDQRLASASTCMNLLKLPPYTDPLQAKEKLLYAINSGAGFELS
jgi:ubiquitin-protein ligase E3 C